MSGLAPSRCRPAQVGPSPRLPVQFACQLEDGVRVHARLSLGRLCGITRVLRVSGGVCKERWVQRCQTARRLAASTLAPRARRGRGSLSRARHDAPSPSRNQPGANAGRCALHCPPLPSDSRKPPGPPPVPTPQRARRSHVAGHGGFPASPLSHHTPATRRLPPSGGYGLPSSPKWTMGAAAFRDQDGWVGLHPDTGQGGLASSPKWTVGAAVAPHVDA